MNKQCICCNLIKPVTDFYRKNNHYHSYCKLCSYEKQKAYRVNRAAKRVYKTKYGKYHTTELPPI